MSKRITRADLEAALPDTTTTQRLAALHQSVDIFRDHWGIPHIRAADEHDVFFAQGFVTAQDRLWHMDYDRHRALGRWAEFVGATGLREDRLMRTFRLERAAKADYAVSSPQAQAMLDAYTAGVNAFMETTSTLPIEYTILDTSPEPWENWHCLAVYKVRNMLMGTFEMKLWRARLALAIGPDKAAALFKGYPQGALLTMPPGETYQGPSLDGFDELAAVAAELNWLGEVDGGSNAWVISGERTASGLPLVAGDSHRVLDTPNVYYQVHMTCPRFRVTGYAVPGVPGAPHFSHTEYVGWGMTHGYADYQDLYIERFRHSPGELEYAHQDAWLPAEVSEETIHVRQAEAESLQVVATQHGSIIASDPQQGYGVAFCHTGTQSGTPWPDAVYQLLVATSADEAEEALREWTEPVNNVVYADIHGEYGYRYRGRIPIRAMSNAWRPVPGWTGEHEWNGLIPFEAMPHVRNPQAGYVVTCNNGVTGDDYPYYINTYFGADFRARRVTQRLQELPKGAAGISDMALVHADRESIPAKAFQSILRQCQASESVKAEPRLAAACERLLQWDCRMHRTSVEATIYAVMRTHVCNHILEAALGPLAGEALGAGGVAGRGAPAHANQIIFRAIAAMEKNDTSPLPSGATWPELVISALRCALDELTERLGQDMQHWTWDQIHYTRPRHPLSRVFPELANLLDPPPVPADGDQDTPQQGGFSPTDRCVLISMSVNRYIHDPSDWRRSRWIVPLGASGHPGSPHFADQAGLWSDVETIPQYWDWHDIQSNCETQQILLPSD